MNRSSCLRSSAALLATVAAAGMLAAPSPAAAADAPKIGVTLHPYFSWTRAVVKGTPLQVVSVLPGDVDAGNYQPRPDDIRKLKTLDALVINDLGHDDFIHAMLKASGNQKVQLIRPNEGTPVIRSASGKEVNSHTFISFTNAVQQTYAIERALSKRWPKHAATFGANARAYAKKLRKIKAKAATQLAEASVTRALTVHDGYSYLLQEFGLDLVGVVEPSHGLVPSAGELENVIKLLNNEKAKVVLTEESFPKPLLDTLAKETGAKVYVISHIASGPYTDEKFEREMADNARRLVEALVGK